MNLWSKVLGGVLLIIGTSIGGGMLALPLSTAAGGFVHSFFLFLGVWSITVLAGFYILEINLWLPEGTNMISMAKSTLGVGGQIITWLCYLFLLYALVAAYISGGTDLTQSLLQLIHIKTPEWLDSIIFTVLFGAILYFGVHAVDLANRALMIGKLVGYTLLVIFVAPHVNFANLESGSFRLLAGAVMVVVISFGYTIIIPTLRTYFKSNVNALRLTIAVGSLIPLFCYLIWDLVVQGSLKSHGPDGLIQITHSGHQISELTGALSYRLGSKTISDLAHFFTSICITTSFLGVSLCLTDFFADGLQVRKRGFGNWITLGLTLLPPLLIVFLYPAFFIKGLKLAGIICIILLTLMPALMVWSGRYRVKIAAGYQVIGGKVFVILEILISIVLLIYGLFDFHW